MLATMLALGACSNTNLGDIDESVDSREQMPGPGIFADDAGESALSWNTASDNTASETQPAQPAASGDRAEFEQFKAWQELRGQGNESPEYREFQQWLEFQKFKATGD